MATKAQSQWVSRNMKNVKVFLSSDSLQISIPSELIGSIPRTDALFKARILYESDLLLVDELRKIEKEAIEQTVKELDQLTGSVILTDGEQTKPSFLTYPINDLVFECYQFDSQCFQITFTDGQLVNKFDR